MNRETQILKFAAALFGGKWALVFGLGLSGILLLFAAAVLLVPTEVLGKPYPLVGMAGMLSAVGLYCCIYGIVDLPQVLERNQALRLAPYGKQHVFALRQRLIWLAILMLFALFVLQPYTLLLDRSFDRPYVSFGEITARDVLVPLVVLVQGAFYVWVLAKWVKAPFNTMFIPIYAAANGPIAFRMWWWPFFAFAVVLVGVSLWRRLVSRNEMHSSDHKDSANLASNVGVENIIQRHAQKRWESYITSLRSDGYSRPSASQFFEHVRGAIPATDVALVLGLVLLLSAVRNWAESGFFVYVWIAFASVLALHARAIPLLPSMLLPIGLSRKNVAQIILWVWFRRDVFVLLTAGTLASAWVAIASRFDVWMPFANNRRFPWVEPDPLVVHPSIGVMSFVAVNLGLLLCTRLVFSATPMVASNPLRFAWVRGIFVFIPPITMFAIELYLRPYATQFPLLESLTLRSLLVACVVLPSLFIVYFLIMRRTWQTANIAKVSETYLATEVKMMQNFLGRDAAGSVSRA